MKTEIGRFRLVGYACIFFLAIIVAVNSTFSWYDRNKADDEFGHILNYSQTGKVTDNTPKTISTYLGADNGGIISYSDTEFTGNITVFPNKPIYFKTVIKDEGGSGDANVSLYVDGLSCSQNLGADYHIGITSPEKAYKSVKGNAVGELIEIGKICIEDNLTVKSNGTVEIYWFIKVDNTDFSGSGTLTPGSMYITFN